MQCFPCNLIGKSIQRSLYFKMINLIFKCKKGRVFDDILMYANRGLYEVI